ncbi:MAG: hypothetical protein M0Z79_11285 [Nitrospiraceae bacterium]|nr:hypothetical protein [Nitrospiraceae bacterium]
MRFYNPVPRKFLLHTAVLVVVLAMAAGALSPLLKSGFVSDDAVNSIERGVLMLTGQSRAASTYAAVKSWIFHNGRLFPLSFIANAFQITDDLAWYKATTLAVVLFSIALFWLFVYLLMGSLPLAILSVSFLPLIFQFRLYHDPVLGFGWLQEFVFIYTVSSLILLVKYLKTDRRLFLYLSVLVYCVAVLTYEASSVFLVFHMTVILGYAGKITRRTLFVFAPYFFVVLLWGGLTFLLRQTIPSHYAGTRLNPDMALVYATFIRQVSASVPFVYYLVDPHRVFAGMPRLVNAALTIPAILFSAGYCLVFLVVRHILEREKASPVTPGFMTIVFLGFCLTVAPGMVVSLSEKYQNELVFGIGYLPVYSSYFGVSLLLGTAVFATAGRLSGSRPRTFPLIAAAALFCGTLGAINYCNNSLVVEKTNVGFLYPRSLIEEAMHRGLISDAAQGSSLIVESDYDLDKVQGGWNYYRWDVPAFYLMHAGVRFRQVVSKGEVRAGGFQRGPLSAEALRGLSRQASESPGVYYLAYGSASRSDGFAIFSRLQRLSGAPDSISEAVSDNTAYLYIRHASDHRPRVAVEGVQRFSPDAGGLGPNKRFTMSDSAFELLKRGDNWELFALRGGPVNLASLKVVIITEKSPSDRPL